MLFCQREAAETAIFLAEVAGRQGGPDFRTRIDAENDLPQRRSAAAGVEDGDGHGQDRRDGDAHRLADDQQGRSRRATPGSPSGSSSSRRASRSATGSGCSCPSDEDNYYRQRDLVPADLWARAASRRRSSSRTTTPSCRATAKEMQGRRGEHPQDPHCRQGGRPVRGDPTTRSVTRVLRDSRAASGKAGEIVVLNDEAHHCYQDKPLEEADADVDERDKEDKDAQRGRPGRGSRVCSRWPRRSASRRSTTCRRRRTT